MQIKIVATKCVNCQIPNQQPSHQHLSAPNQLEWAGEGCRGRGKKKTGEKRDEGSRWGKGQEMIGGLGKICLPKKRGR